MKKALLLFLTLGIYLFLVGRFLNTYLADVYFASSKNYLSEGNLIKSSDHIIMATRFNTYEPAYKRQKAKVLLATLVWQENREVKEKVLEELIKAQDLNPKNLATLRNIIPLYYLLSVKDVEKVGSCSNIDDGYVLETTDFYSALKKSYPNDLGVFTDIAEYEKKLGLMHDYNNTYDQAMKMRPDIVDWYGSFK
ncbi:hypothetical protein ACFLZK_00050 [Patescibacteria group bacterium]